MARGGLCQLNRLVEKLFVALIGTAESERIGNSSFALLHAGDHVGAADPMRFGEIGLRPLRRMIGMGVVEANDVFSAFPAFALDAYQFSRVDVVAIMGGIGASVATPSRRGDDSSSIVFKPTQQNAAAFVRIGFFPVLANRVVIFWIYFQHRNKIHHRGREK